MGMILDSPDTISSDHDSDDNNDNNASSLAESDTVESDESDY